MTIRDEDRTRGDLLEQLKACREREAARQTHLADMDGLVRQAQTEARDARRDMEAFMTESVLLAAKVAELQAAAAGPCEACMRYAQRLFTLRTLADERQHDLAVAKAALATSEAITGGLARELAAARRPWWAKLIGIRGSIGET